MKNPDRAYGGHLNLKDFAVPAGGEWSSPLTGWSVLQVRKGSGYFMQPRVNQELDAGSVILVPHGVKGSIRASQLGELAICVFSVTPARLTGLITLSEQRQLEMAASNELNVVRILPPASLAAAKMEELHAGKKRDGLLFRLKLLQFFVELIGHKLEQSIPAGESSDAKQRLQMFLKETPSSEFLEMNFNDLARCTGCTSRHLGRLFQELMGMSFRDKRAEIRLERARELLATTDCKIVDVAMESGFKSLSLFNLMFSRHFGFSPGRWRQHQESLDNVEARENDKGFSIASGLNFSLKANAPARADQGGPRPSGKKSLRPMGATGGNRFLSPP